MRTLHERQAADIQYHWNTTLTRPQRAALYARSSERLERVFEELGLTVMCQDCRCIFPEETFADWEECPECGSGDLEGYRGNPVLQAQAAAEREHEMLLEQRYEEV